MKFTTDYENDNEDFWNAVHCDADNSNRIARKLINTDTFSTSKAEGEEIIKYLRSKPGWNDPEAPEYAPHPIFIEK